MKYKNCPRNPSGAASQDQKRRSSCISLGPISLNILTPANELAISSTKELIDDDDDEDDDEDDEEVSRITSSSAVVSLKQQQPLSTTNWHRESLKMRTRQPRQQALPVGQQLNKSQGCIKEALERESADCPTARRKSDKCIARKSTSDLTELNDADTEITVLSSPRRRGSMKGGLGQLLIIRNICSISEMEIIMSFFNLFA